MTTPSNDFGFEWTTIGLELVQLRKQARAQKKRLGYVEWSTLNKIREVTARAQSMLVADDIERFNGIQDATS